MILILSDPDTDIHTTTVTSELDRRGEKFVIFNPATYPLDSTLTVEYKRPSLKSHICWNGSKVDLSLVKSVWYRRPGGFKISKSLYREESEWLKTECTHFFKGLWLNLNNILWVSNPENIYRASLKLLQLRVASELGFRVPRFIVTNDVEQARSFIKSINGGVVVKALAEPAIFSQERVATLYTHLLTEEDYERIDSVRFGPTFFQEFIPKRKDIRVTVIGRSLFATAIDTSEFNEARIDFRRAEIFDLPHERMDLPRSVKASCIELVHRLGLQFGAIDLLLDSDGKYFFLEINPNGQWLWIEWITGIPLSRIMCDLLSY